MLPRRSRPDPSTLGTTHEARESHYTQTCSRRPRRRWRRNVPSTCDDFPRAGAAFRAAAAAVAHGIVPRPDDRRGGPRLCARARRAWHPDGPQAAGVRAVARKSIRTQGTRQRDDGVRLAGGAARSGLLSARHLLHQRRVQFAEIQQPRIRRTGERAGGRTRSDQTPGAGRQGAGDTSRGSALLAGVLTRCHQSGQQEAVPQFQAVEGAGARNISCGPVPRAGAGRQRTRGQRRDDVQDEFGADLQRALRQRTRLSSLRLRHVSALRRRSQFDPVGGRSPTGSSIQRPTN